MHTKRDCSARLQAALPAMRHCAQRLRAKPERMQQALEHSHRLHRKGRLQTTPQPDPFALVHTHCYNTAHACVPLSVRYSRAHTINSVRVRILTISRSVEAGSLAARTLPTLAGRTA